MSRAWDNMRYAMYDGERYGWPGWDDAWRDKPLQARVLASYARHKGNILATANEIECSTETVEKIIDQADVRR